MAYDQIKLKRFACCMCMLICVQLFAIPWTVAHQAPMSRGFPRQEYYSGLPFPTPGDLPDPGIKPTSLGSPALPGRFFTTEPFGNPKPKPFLILWRTKETTDSGTMLLTVVYRWEWPWSCLL